MVDRRATFADGGPDVSESRELAADIRGTQRSRAFPTLPQPYGNVAATIALATPSRARNRMMA
jgi:hypothetical protein